MNDNYNVDLTLFNDVNKITEFNSDDTKAYRKEKQVINEIKDYFTDSQRDRDRQITILLKQFVLNYENKVNGNKTFKKVLFYFCLAFITIFGLGILGSIIILSIKNITITEIVPFVSACATLIAVPIGIFKIIVSYTFPSKEEQHIADIVQLIQNNDLENKKINIKALNDEKIDK